MELKQELKLKQTLSQKMIQSANILQMGQIELKEYIEEMALENPVVDLEERQPESRKAGEGEDPSGGGAGTFDSERRGVPRGV